MATSSGSAAHAASQSRLYALQEPQGCELSDDAKAQLALRFVNVSSPMSPHGAEAGAAIRAIKDPIKQEEAYQVTLAALTKFDQSSAAAYDAMAGFIYNLAGVERS